MSKVQSVSNPIASVYMGSLSLVPIRSLAHTHTYTHTHTHTHTPGKMNQCRVSTVSHVSPRTSTLKRVEWTVTMLFSSGGLLGGERWEGEVWVV